MFIMDIYYYYYYYCVLNFIVTTKHIEFNGKKTAITWLNALAFYHKQGTGYWYYAFDDQKSVYHCVKWFTGDGFYEMARKSMT